MGGHFIVPAGRRIVIVILAQDGQIAFQRHVGPACLILVFARYKKATLQRLCAALYGGVCALQGDGIVRFFRQCLGGTAQRGAVFILSQHRLAGGDEGFRMIGQILQGGGDALPEFILFGKFPFHPSGLNRDAAPHAEDNGEKDHHGEDGPGPGSVFQKKFHGNGSLTVQFPAHLLFSSSFARSSPSMRPSSFSAWARFSLPSA